MAENLDNGNFVIVSLADALPVGVNHTMPAWQIVYLDAPVRDWKFRRVGNKTYKLSINGYAYTGVLDGKFIASIHPEHEEDWVIVYQELQRAFTIALAKKPEVGWTVSFDDERHREIELKPIIVTATDPPQFLTTQLFSLKEALSD